MLVKGLSTAEAPIAVVAFKVMSRRVEMLVEGLLATKRAVACITLVCWDMIRRAEMLVQSLPAVE
jgi:hypothetical protein